MTILFYGQTVSEMPHMITLILLNRPKDDSDKNVSSKKSKK